MYTYTAPRGLMDMQLSIYAAAATASHSRVTGFAIGLSRPDVDYVADGGSVVFPAAGRAARAACVSGWFFSIFDIWLGDTSIDMFSPLRARVRRYPFGLL